MTENLNPRKRIKLAIIEDEELSIRLLMLGLKFDPNLELVSLSKTKDEASKEIDNFNEKGVNVVLLDRMLRGIDCIGFVEQIRTSSPGTFIISTSGHGQCEGTDAYIEKSSFGNIGEVVPAILGMQIEG